MKKDGIILLNKIKGISSFKAINQIKWNIGASKIGHAGTLDPMAEGLMVVMVNSATKFSEDLMKKDKEYYVEMELGYETDTYDTEGKKTKIYDEIIEYDEQNVKDVINSFVGIQDQIPPMYSALKVNGRKMYEMAREGIEIERKPRRVEIYSIRDITIKGKRITFYVEVSSGTYIRSLVRDIGEKLSFWATMTKLIRTKIDKYSLENAFLFEEIEKLDNKEELIIDIESLFLFCIA